MREGTTNIQVITTGIKDMDTTTSLNINYLTHTHTHTHCENNTKTMNTIILCTLPRKALLQQEDSLAEAIMDESDVCEALARPRPRPRPAPRARPPPRRLAPCA